MPLTLIDTCPETNEPVYIQEIKILFSPCFLIIRKGLALNWCRGWAWQVKADSTDTFSAAEKIWKDYLNRPKSNWKIEGF